MTGECSKLFGRIIPVLTTNILQFTYLRKENKQGIILFRKGMISEFTEYVPFLDPTNRFLIEI